jgi:GTP cyclohydrolase II
MARLPFAEERDSMHSSALFRSPALRLFGDPDQTAVERAIADIRAGRPVLVGDGLTAVLAMPVELADERLIEGLLDHAKGPGHLLLAAPRLRHLHAPASETARRFPLTSFDQHRIDQLVRSTTTSLDDAGEPVSPIEEAALELARLAYLLPAMLAVTPTDQAATLAEGAVKVDAGAVFAYRDRAARLMRIVSRSPVPLAGARDSEFVVFRGGEGMRDQVAVVVGDPDLAKPVTTRIHSACLTGDLFGSLKCDCGDQLRGAVRRMAENGGGVLLYLDQEGRGSGIANKMRAYRLQCEGMDTYDADEALGIDLDGRHFAMAGVMLSLLGIARVRILTNNPEKVAALRAAGIDVVQDVRMFGRPTQENVRYLSAKRDRAGHRIDAEALFDVPAAQ